MTHPYYPFSTERRHPYFPYAYGDEYVRGLSDVTPLGILIPPAGLAQGFGFGSSKTSPSPNTDWSVLAKVGLVVGGIVGAYFIYRGVRTSFYMSRSAIRGALESK